MYENIIFKLNNNFQIQKQMNYHFNVPTNNKLLQQLQEIDQDIQSKRNQLSKKQVKQKQLQNQFYQDDNKIQLADEVMNQLLAGYPKNKNKPQIKFDNQFQEDSLNVQHNKYDHIWKNSEKKPYEPQSNYRQMKINYPIRQQPRPQYKNSRISYQTENKRQLEKRKLQERGQQQFFPFEDRKPKMVVQPPVSIPPPINKNRNNKEIVIQRNPFLKEEQNNKEKKQEQLRNYYKELQRQRQLELQRKQKQKKQKKQQLYQFNDYVPPSTTTNTDNNIKKTKKVDPNGKPPQIQTNSLNSDTYYMKLKVEELKQKRKRGRIDEDQYRQSLKKIEQFYGIKLEQDEEENIYEKKNEEPERNYFDRIQQSRQNQIQQPNAISKEQTPEYQPNYRPTIPEPIKVQQSRVNQQSTLKSNNSYSNSHLAYTKQFSQIEREMMMKLLEDMREMYKHSLMHNQKIMQEAFMTQMQMLPQYQYFQNTVAQTMQLPPQNRFPDSSVQKNSHYSDNKTQNYSVNRNSSANHLKQFGQSQLSEVELQQASLSGIVTKIPLTEKQLRQNQLNNNNIQQFYSKKYKVKAFKSFPYIEAANQTKKQINHITNFLDLGENGQKQLRNNFAEDLQMYKKMQLDKEVAALKNKMAGPDKKPKKKQQNEEKIQTNKQNTIKPTAFQKKKNHEDEPIVNRQEQFAQFYSKQGLNYQRVLTEKQLVTPSRQNNIFGNPFLKKHISDKQQSYYKQYRQQSTPIPKIPDINSNPILEQEQYQTQSKDVSESIKTLQQESVSKEDKPIGYALNNVYANNQVFRKLIEKGYKSPSQQSFGQISPVKMQIDHHAYQSSLQTLKSQQFQSKEKLKRILDSAQSNGQGISQAISQGSVGYISPKNHQSIKELQFIESRQSHHIKQKIKSPQNSNNNQLLTCQSIQESSCKMSMIRKPPTLKKARSTSRKKQTSLVRSKMGNESINSSTSVDKLNSIQQRNTINNSEPIYPTQQQKLLKPPSFNPNTLKDLESPRFDSKVFQSQYEQTVNASEYRQLLAQNNPNRLLRSKSKEKIQQYNKTNEIEIPRPQFYQSLQKFYKQEEFSEAQNIVTAVKNDENKDIVNTNSEIAQFSGKSKSAPRFKSLQEARNMARQCRIKMGDDHNRSNVQEKLSQLQSFMAQKRQQSFLSKQEVKISESRKKEQPSIKKNMLSILDDLQQKEYDDDFESYREDSSIKK